MNEWEKFSLSIKNDIDQYGISNFRKFKAVYSTMYAGDGFWHIVEKYVPEDIQKLIKKSVVNKTDFYTLASQYYNISMFKSLQDLDLLKLDSIIEFGGGVGAMAHLMRLMGYKGKYTIFDLPEVSQIQSYYLDSVGIKDVELTQNFPTYKSDLFIGCWSISEASPRPELSFFPSDLYWIAYQPVFSDIRNNEYFHERLDVVGIKSAPHHCESKYLVGKPFLQKFYS